MIRSKPEATTASTPRDQGRIKFKRKQFKEGVQPGIGFTNILRGQVPKVQKDTDDMIVFLHFWDLHV